MGLNISMLSGRLRPPLLINIYAVAHRRLRESHNKISVAVGRALKEQFAGSNRHY